MSLTIQYTGQLANVLGTSREMVEAEPGMSLRTLVDRILARHGAQAEIFFRDTRGELPSTLLVIFDGEQVAVADRGGCDLAGVREILFMSPIAGG